VFPGARRRGQKGANRRVDAGPRIIIEVGDGPRHDPAPVQTSDG
jgi:hypothetical protein